MTPAAALVRAEALIDSAGVGLSLEAVLPIGGRPRQLSARALLVGMLLAAADGRPAHLVRVHGALIGLDEAQRRRLGVEVDWRGGPHLLTYRQVERTAGLVSAALAKPAPDGEPSEALVSLIDTLVEASIPTEHKNTTTAEAVDWTDYETWSRPGDDDRPAADAEASWGHRKPNAPGARHETFLGYYFQAATMVAEDSGPAVPELIRRVLVAACHVDPPPAFVAVFRRMVGAGIALGDVLADSGYAYRNPASWALPLRGMGARLVTDLHPNDRGPKGIFSGAVIANGNLYCPATPKALLSLGPLAPNASGAEAIAHDAKTAELARYKLGRISSHDPDGYHRVSCPAISGKLRCPLRAGSMALSLDHPEIFVPPPSPPTCCVQASITVPPSVNAKTTQKHDYPSAAHRRSYGRRTAVERAYSTLKDRATTNIDRGWCRLMGLVPITLFLTTAVISRNWRIIDAFDARRAAEARGQLPRVRRRRRQSLNELIEPTPS